MYIATFVHNCVEKKLHAFRKSISTKVNLRVHLEFELSYFEGEIQPFSNRATGATSQ